MATKPTTFSIFLKMCKKRIAARNENSVSWVRITVDLQFTHPLDLLIPPGKGMDTSFRRGWKAVTSKSWVAKDSEDVGSGVWSVAESKRVDLALDRNGVMQKDHSYWTMDFFSPNYSELEGNCGDTHCNRVSAFSFFNRQTKPRCRHVNKKKCMNVMGRLADRTSYNGIS